MVPVTVVSGYHPFSILARPPYVWEPEHNWHLLKILCRFLFNKTQFLWLLHPLVSPINPCFLHSQHKGCSTDQQVEVSLPSEP